MMEAFARVLYRVILTAVHLGEEGRYFGTSVQCSGETKQPSGYGKYD